MGWELKQHVSIWHCCLRVGFCFGKATRFPCSYSSLVKCVTQYLATVFFKAFNKCRWSLAWIFKTNIFPYYIAMEELENQGFEKKWNSSNIFIEPFNPHITVILFWIWSCFTKGWKWMFSVNNENLEEELIELKYIYLIFILHMHTYN